VSNPEVHTLAAEQSLADLTKEQLIDMVEEQNRSGIRISFSGKTNARKLARKVRPRVMRTVKKNSCGSLDEQARNLLIEGDNLQAMATLYRDRGQVDLIVTDPPYNTGNDFRYNDRWEEDPNDPGLGEWVGPDDGARHTKWMRFMWPRLQMMKSMLRPGGVLAICIDFRELFQLGQMLDELFERENRLGVINWQRTYSRQNDSEHLATTTEYVLVYTRDEDKAHTSLLPRPADPGATQNPDTDPLPWTDAPATASNAKAHRSMVYAIQNPLTGELLYPPEGSAWRDEQARNLSDLKGWGCKYVLRDLGDLTTRAALAGLPESDMPAVKGIVLDEPVETAAAKYTAVRDSGQWPRLFFLRKGRGRPRRKKYLSELQAGLVPTTFWANEDFEGPLEVGPISWEHRISGHSQQGVDELSQIVGAGHDFKTVKPMRLIRQLVQIWCPPGGLVLDPFAGSGTTGHAVLALNAEESEADPRRFICIEQGSPQNGDPYASTLTADRLTRVISGDWAASKKGPALGGGYRYCRLDRKVDAEALLSMEREDLADTIIASHFDATSRRRDALVRVGPEAGFRHLVAKSAQNEGFFLIWGGADGNTDFDDEVYEECAEEAQRAGLNARYHVYARLYLFQTSNVAFYQIPDRILMDFGLDLRGEPYYESDDA
jgi:adenine-specific DNA-methyltransferase